MSAVEMYKKRVMEAMKAGDLNGLRTIAGEIEEDKKRLSDVTENIRGLMTQLKYFATADDSRPAVPKPEPKPGPKPEPAPAPVVAPPAPVVVPVVEPVVPEPELVFTIEDTPELVIAPKPEPVEDVDIDLDELMAAADASRTPSTAAPDAGEFDISFLDIPAASSEPADSDGEIDLDFDY